MAERPIIFSAPMVRAILCGRKTQTRRKTRLQPVSGDRNVCKAVAYSSVRCREGDRLWVREACRAEELSRPPATRLATAKERLALKRTEVVVHDDLDGTAVVRYLADSAWRRIENSPEAADRWSELYHYRGRGKAGIDSTVPPIHMPRWASRLTLLVTDVRVTRLQEISEEDAQAEGIELHRLMGATGWVDYGGKPGDMTRRYFSDPRASYRSLWNSLHGASAWDANPWVSATTFVVEADRG